MDDLRQCRDGHRCENGSLCQENINQEGSYYCDCESAVGGLYAGLSCEFKAEEECRFEGGVEAVWFCVNKGTCVVSESKDKLTMRCDCTDEFEGPVSRIKKRRIDCIQFCYLFCLFAKRNLFSFFLSVFYTAL